MESSTTLQSSEQRNFIDFLSCSPSRRLEDLEASRYLQRSRGDLKASRYLEISSDLKQSQAVEIDWNTTLEPREFTSLETSTVYIQTESCYYWKFGSWWIVILKFSTCKVLTLHTPVIVSNRTHISYCFKPISARGDDNLLHVYREDEISFYCVWDKTIYNLFLLVCFSQWCVVHVGRSTWLISILEFEN